MLVNCRQKAFPKTFHDDCGCALLFDVLLVNPISFLHLLSDRCLIIGHQSSNLWLHLLFFLLYMRLVHLPFNLLFEIFLLDIYSDLYWPLSDFLELCNALIFVMALFVSINLIFSDIAHYRQSRHHTHIMNWVWSISVGVKTCENEENKQSLNTTLQI